MFMSNFAAKDTSLFAKFMKNVAIRSLNLT